MTHTPRMDFPTLYVYYAKDMALDLDWQNIMVGKAIKNGAKAVSVRELESSHSPFWSMPAALVGIMEDAWKQ